MVLYLCSTAHSEVREVTYSNSISLYLKKYYLCVCVLTVCVWRSVLSTTSKYWRWNSGDQVCVASALTQQATLLSPPFFAIESHVSQVPRLVSNSRWR